MLVSLAENRIHELHLGLIDITQAHVAPSIRGAIQWPHFRQRLPWAAIGSQICSSIGPPQCAECLQAGDTASIREEMGAPRFRDRDARKNVPSKSPRQRHRKTAS